MLGNILRALRTLIYGDGCIICGGYVERGAHSICSRCRIDIPLTNYYFEKSNPVKERFDGFVGVEHASALFYYMHDTRWQKLIHRFKYSGQWQLAYAMGRWYGALLKESGFYDDIDVIIPLPLHPIKIVKRGYNQSRYIAEGIAHEMGVKLDTRAVRRVRNNPPQARRKASARWANVNSLFGVTRKERLRGKHILVVDDVITTGATLISCLQTIREAVPECKISVAALATTIHPNGL